MTAGSSRGLRVSDGANGASKRTHPSRPEKEPRLMLLESSTEGHPQIQPEKPQELPSCQKIRRSEKSSQRPPLLSENQVICEQARVAMHASAQSARQVRNISCARTNCDAHTQAPLRTSRRSVSRFFFLQKKRFAVGRGGEKGGGKCVLCGGEGVVCVVCVVCVCGCVWVCVGVCGCMWRGVCRSSSRPLGFQKKKKTASCLCVTCFRFLCWPTFILAVEKHAKLQASKKKHRRQRRRGEWAGKWVDPRSPGSRRHGSRAS